MIEVDSLTKRYGPILAVDAVSFSVGPGEVLGFLGPNGAGKSTTMRMIAGFLTPSSGSARVCGFDVLERPVEAKRRVGYMPEGAPAYGEMTPLGFLGFVARARGFRGKEIRKRVALAVERAALGEVLYQPIETLSRGFKRRVGLAQALLHDPEVLILDEPAEGLDPNQKHELRALIRALAAEKTIVISTHILEEVEAVCSRVLIIARGRLVADGRPEELAARARTHNAVALRLKGPAAAEAREELARLPGIGRIEEVAAAGEGPGLLLYPGDSRPILAEVARFVRERGWQVDEIYAERGSLDEVFREITGRA